MRKFHAIIHGLFTVVLAAVAAAGCAEQKSATSSPPVARTDESVRPTVLLTSSGEMKGQCAVTPECPESAKTGEQTTIRSSHTWSVDNPTAEARQFVVILEITDDLGHAKKKEVPGEVKARSKVEDSTSISLVTTYREPGTVQVQAKTTIRMGEQVLSTRSESCRFELP